MNTRPYPIQEAFCIAAAPSYGVTHFKVGQKIKGMQGAYVTAITVYPRTYRGTQSVMHTDISIFYQRKNGDNASFNFRKDIEIFTDNKEATKKAKELIEQGIGDTAKELISRMNNYYDVCGKIVFRKFLDHINKKSFLKIMLEEDYAKDKSKDEAKKDTKAPAQKEELKEDKPEDKKQETKEVKKEEKKEDDKKENEKNKEDNKKKEEKPKKKRGRPSKKKA